MRAVSNLAWGGDDHPEAAGKHLDDASALAAAQRFDGCAYLAGYVAECSLKTVVIVAHVGAQGVAGGSAAARGPRHNLNTLTRDALRLAALPNAATAPYALPATPGVVGWSPEMRYAAPAVAEHTARQWLAEAQSLYQATVVRMRLDGLIQ